MVDPYRDLVLRKSFENWKGWAEHYFSLNKAHLLMLYKTGTVSKDVARAIGRALNDLKAIEVQNLELPADVEDLVFLVEKMLSQKIGTEIAGYLHIARSRNDIDATVFRMVLREKLLQFAGKMVSLLETVIKKMVCSFDTFFLLYTHGQPAQVSTLAHYLAAFFEDTLELVKLLIWSYELVNQSPMGAAAITTTGFQIDRKLVAEYLGFNKPVHNSYRAIVSHEWLFFPSVSVQGILFNISRLIADLIHKSSFEVEFIDFPDELVQISSIMPQKRNPVILEHARIRANKSIELLNIPVKVFLNVPYQDVNEIGDNLVFTFLEGVDTAVEAVTLLQEILLKMKVKVDRVRELSLQTGATTTELADELVRRYAISFRTGHKIVSEYVRKAMDHEILIQRLSENTGKCTPIDKNELLDLLSVEHFVTVRKIYGGPEKQTMEKAVKGYKRNLLTMKRKLKGLENKLRGSIAQLELDFQEMINV